MNKLHKDDDYDHKSIGSQIPCLGSLEELCVFWTLHISNQIIEILFAISGNRFISLLTLSLPGGRPLGENCDFRLSDQNYF